MKQKAFVRSLLGLFAASGVVSAVISLRKRTIRKIHQAEDEKTVSGSRRCVSVSRSIRSEKVSEALVSDETIRVSCGIFRYDLSSAPIENDITLHCDVHMGMLHLILPPCVNVRFDTQAQMSSYFITNERTLAADAPWITIHASLFMGEFSVTKAPASR